MQWFLSRIRRLRQHYKSGVSGRLAAKRRSI